MSRWRTSSSTRFRRSSIEALEAKWLLAADSGARDDFSDVIEDGLCVVDIGQLVTGNGSTRDIDVFAWEATAGTAYAILAQGNSWLQVIGPDRETVLYANHPSNPSSQQWTALESGTHYLKIHTSDAYSFLIDTGGTKQVADFVTGAISTAFETDWYEIQTEDGMAYELMVNGMEGLVAVYGQDRTTRLHADDNGFDARLVFEAESSGTKFVQVRGIGSATSFYDFRFRELPVVTFAPSEPPSDQLDLGVPNELMPRWVDGDIAAFDEVDIFRFQAERGDHFYRIQTELLTLGESRISLWNEAGSMIREDTNSGQGNASQILWKPTESGVYRVDVSGRAGTGQYRLGISAEADDHAATPEQATLLEAGKYVIGSIQHPGDTDRFVASVVEDVAYQFESRGRPFVLRTDSESIGPQEYVAWVATDTGTVSLVMRPNVDATPYYQVRYQPLPDDYPDRPTDDVAAIQIGSTVSGQFEHRGDADVLAFDVGIDQAIHFQVPDHLDERIVDSNGTVLREGYPYDDLVWSSPLAGRFYLELTLGHLQVGSSLYTVTTEYAEDDVTDYLSVGRPVPVLGLNTSVAGSIDYRGDVDVFALDLMAGQDVLITAKGGVGLRIFDPEDQRIDLSLFRAEISGRCQLIATSLSAGDYTLDIQIVPDDHPDADWSTAALLIPGIERTGEFGSPGDRDLFLMDLVAGEKVEIVVSNAAAQIQVFDAQGSLVASGSDPWTPTSSGRYAVVLGTSRAVSYTVTLTRGDDFPDRPSADVKLLANGHVTYGSLETRNDMDVFAVDLVQGDRVFVELQSDQLFSFELWMLTDSGELVERITDRTEFLAYATKRYYLGARSRVSSLRGDYSIKLVWQDDHPDSFEAVGELVTLTPDGPPATIQIGTPDDVDLLAVDVEPGRSVRFELTNPSTSSARISLFDRDGSRLREFGGSEFEWRADDARYFVQIGFDDETTADLSLTLQTITVTDDLPDVGSVTSPQLQLGTPAQATIEVANDRDVWRFEAGEEEVISFSVEPINGGSFSAQTRILGQDAATELQSGARNLVFDPPIAGTYFVEVTSIDGLREIQLQAVKYVDEHPDQVADEAVLLTKGEEQVGVLESPQDRDVFQLTAAAGEVVMMTPQPSSRNLTSVILNEQGNSLFEADLDQLFWPVPESGTYYLSVRNDSSSGLELYGFTFRTAVDEVGDTIQEAPTIPLSVEVSGRSEYWGDRDVYALNVQEGIDYRLLSSLRSGRIEVLDSEGALVAQRSDGFIVWESSYSGEVYVRLTPGRSDFDYQFSVDAVADDHPDVPSETAQLVELGKTYQASFEVYRDRDVFRFDLTEGDAFQLQLSKNYDFRRNLRVQRDTREFCIPNHACRWKRKPIAVVRAKARSNRTLEGTGVRDILPVHRTQEREPPGNRLQNHRFVVRRSWWIHAQRHGP